MTSYPNPPVWLDRPPREGDMVQLINASRMYSVVCVLDDGKLRLWKRHWPRLDVWPEKVRVWNPARRALTLPAGAGGMVTEKDGEECQ